MVEPPVSYLEANSPCRCLQDGYRIWVCGLGFFGSSYPISLTILSLTPLPPHHHRYGKQKITGDRLNALAKANNYQKDAHQDKDSLRDRTKYTLLTIDLLPVARFRSLFYRMNNPLVEANPHFQCKDFH